MVEESLIPSVLCSPAAPHNGHTTQGRVKRTRIVQPASKKCSAKAISCLRNCQRCRSVLLVRGLHPASQPRIMPSVAAAARMGLAHRGRCDLVKLGAEQRVGGHASGCQDWPFLGGWGRSGAAQLPGAARALVRPPLAGEDAARGWIARLARRIPHLPIHRRAPVGTRGEPDQRLPYLAHTVFIQASWLGVALKQH